jgi:hypothetical protein
MSKTVKLGNAIRQTEKIKVELSSLQKTNNPCDNCYNADFVPIPLDLLDLETQVIPMIQNYHNNQYQNITQSGMSPIPGDARTVYFSLAKLKSFIYEIENRCCPCKDELGELGIRFYYAAYDNTMSLTTGPDPYAGKHTLVMVPTYTKDFLDGNPPQHVDFSPYMWEEGKKCQPASLEVAAYGGVDPIGRAVAGATLQSASGSSKILALIGGYDDVQARKKKDNQGRPKKAASKKTAIPKKSADAAIARVGVPDTDPIDDGTIGGFMNHGDLVPPPVIGSITPATRYKGAVLLNC